MTGRAVKRRNDQSQSDQSKNSMISIANIKFEISDDWEEVVCKEETESKFATTINLKNENKIQVSRSTHGGRGIVQPPQKKTKLNNGRYQAPKSSIHVNIKRETLSPIRNRADYNRQRTDFNQRQRCNSYNHNNSSNLHHVFNELHIGFNISDNILQRIQLSSHDKCLLVQEYRQEITELFNFLWHQDQNERSYIEHLIVAKIQIKNHGNLSLQNIYHAMRRDMVDWIERYQAKSGGETPIYHNAFIDVPLIIVMCNDSNAYNNLTEYINFNYQRDVNIEYLPTHAGLVLYMYAVTANNLVFDTDRFQKQIYFHTSNRAGAAIFAHKWILVKHQLHKRERFTSFVFLMDWTSSFTLKYVDKNRIFVCMLDVKFDYRGTINCNF